MNMLLNVDSYKASHYLQYPPSTDYISSYIESRGGQFPTTLFFGLQAYLKQYLEPGITRANLGEAEEILTAHGLPFNREGWEYILRVHGGRLPIEIEAVAEGTNVPIRNVMLQAVNTDPNCEWLTSYLETSLLRAIWYPTTIATYSRACRQIIAKYLDETSDTIAGLPFKLHDFGARGVSSLESAMLGGMGHLLSFQGTDTVSALVAARRYYNEPMAGFSIPAAEHSTITAWGPDREMDAYANMLDRFSGDGKVVAVVSDSYDLWRAISDIWGGELKQRVIDNGGTVVVRPDSGDPVTVVSDAIEALMKHFGATHNERGYRILPDYIRVIQGDGINIDSIEGILAEMKKRRLSADNVAFGMGGALLQKHDRDTQRFAMKASALSIRGDWRDVYKNPATDPGKSSKPGRLALIRDEDGQLATIRKEELGDRENLLRPVFRNGKLLVDEDFTAIRDRVLDGMTEL